MDSEGPESTGIPGRGVTILVVEDDEMVSSILTDFLTDLDYDVLVASDADLAISFLQSERRIDLMVSDVILPHINGRKLAQIAHATRPALKVIFITGYAEEATLADVLEDPRKDVLAKPFALDDLRTKVETLLGRDGTAA